MLSAAILVFVVTTASALAQVPDAKTGYDEGGQFWRYSDSHDAINQKIETTESKDDSSARYEAQNLNAADDDDPSSDLMSDDPDSDRQGKLLGPGRWFFNTRIGQRLAQFESGDIRKRPMMYWRRFADRRVPPVGTFLFFVFFNSLFCLAFRKRVGVASACVRKSFWKSLFIGMVFVILMGSAARLCFDSVLFAPAALLILGCVELLVLGGLAVSSMTVGTAILNRLGVATSSAHDADETANNAALSVAEKLKSCLHYLAPVFLATVLVTLIALIPTLGFLPRMGTRFVMWFSVLGLGALVRTRLGRKELN
ncbi:MAG: hypothetical protein K2Y39_15160 [Candidatus Obscuribacterales bacterium]|nr:hypothetical protein [Candidatus Obscuribacterales bacterium]